PFASQHLAGRMFNASFLAAGSLDQNFFRYRLISWHARWPALRATAPTPGPAASAWPSSHAGSPTTIWPCHPQPEVSRRAIGAPLALVSQGLSRSLAVHRIPWSSRSQTPIGRLPKLTVPDRADAPIAGLS